MDSKHASDGDKFLYMLNTDFQGLGRNSEVSDHIIMMTLHRINEAKFENRDSENVGFILSLRYDSSELPF